MVVSKSLVCKLYNIHYAESLCKHTDCAKLNTLHKTELFSDCVKGDKPLLSIYKWTSQLSKLTHPQETKFEKYPNNLILFQLII